MATSTSTSTEFLTLVRRSGLVEEAKLTDLFPTPDDVPEDAQRTATALVRAGLLTVFHTRQLLAGKFRGFLLGVYKILQPIGKGGMGTVFLAEHTGLKRKVALKVLPNHKAESKLSLERFQREARSAAALDHPNIVRLHDISQGNGLHFIVLEYVDGVDLQSLMAKTGPLHFVQAVEYVAQAAAGLHHAHERGFVHRDIKPANLMLAKDGTVKLLDMGLARSFTDDADKLTEQLGDAAEVAGTADYISPEQALNQVVDERADVYSLGATLFALMTGCPPFRGTTAQKLMQHQVSDPPSLTKLRGVIPPPLNVVVAKMMAKKPADRYQSMADVIDALSPWLPAPTTGNIVHDPLNTAEIRASRSSVTLPAADVATPPPVGGLSRSALPGLRSNRVPLYVGGGVAAVAVLAGVAVAAFSLGSADPVPTTTRNSPVVAATPPPPRTTPQPTSQPTTAPKAAVVATPVPVAIDGQLLFALDLSRQPVFSERGQTRAKSADGKQKEYVRLDQTGGAPPIGWRGQPWNTQTEGEWAARLVDGEMALGFRNPKGPGSMMGLAPPFKTATSRVTLWINYRLDSGKTSASVRFKQNKPMFVAAVDVVKLPTTNGQWVTKAFDVDLNGATEGLFEFHNSTGDPDVWLWFRAIRITEGESGAVATTNTPAARPTASRSSGKLVYRLDLSATQPFVQSRLGRAETGKIGEGRLPAKWIATSWQPDNAHEVVAESRDGALALGIHTVTGTPGMMLALSDLAVSPGRTYEARFDYMATGQFRDALIRVKGASPTVMDVGRLTRTSGAWKSETVRFTADGPVTQIEFHHAGPAGDGNELFVRNVEVVELNP